MVFIGDAFVGSNSLQVFEIKRILKSTHSCNRFRLEYSRCSVQSNRIKSAPLVLCTSGSIVNTKEDNKEGVTLFTDLEKSAKLYQSVEESIEIGELECRLKLNDSLPISLRNGLENIKENFPYGQLFALFSALTKESQFKTEICQKLPFFFDSKTECFVDLFTLKNLEEYVERDFLQAVRGAVPNARKGWFMTDVGEPRGESFEDAKMRFEDVRNSLQKGTVVFNSAGGNIPELAAICLAVQNGFQLPTNINLYVTAPFIKTSAPPHTDKQDVFVIQTQGQKHWRVFKPPEPKKKSFVDMFQRGKGEDALTLKELDGLCYYDVILKPGNVLYIPAGWPHTTDTQMIDADASNSVTSMHLTVGIDTHIWGLTWDYLRRSVMNLTKNESLKSLDTFELDLELFYSMHTCLPLGFMCEGEEDCLEFVANELNSRVEMIVGTQRDEEKLSKETIQVVYQQLNEHCKKLCMILYEMYSDTVMGLIEVPAGIPSNVTLFHVQKSMQKLNAQMELLIQSTQTSTTDEIQIAKNSKSSLSSSGFGGVKQKSKKMKSKKR